MLAILKGFVHQFQGNMTKNIINIYYNFDMTWLIGMNNSMY